MGSTGDWNKVSFLNGQEYEKYNIITAGDIAGVLKGKHIFSYPFINSASLFNYIDLVICHGGNGTTYQALSHGIPLLCKTSHLEQEYNLDGIERLQLGASLDDAKWEECAPIIEHWIQQKNNNQLAFIRDRITETNEKFQGIIDTIVMESCMAQEQEFHEEVSSLSTS
jgi:UDP-N-acetylglucosamine:LPS N-acetylglucosamine transferase